MKFLNLGCGNRFIKSWTNIDFIKTGSEVIAYNFISKIPFATGEFDVIYHSHVLEHFSKEDGKNFISECYRVLKPGGTIRIAVPDLEVIVKEYLLNLDKALSGNKEAENNYEWMILEMYDQVVRNESGGNMLKYWLQLKIANESYVRERLGNEFTAFRKNVATTQTLPQPSSKKYSLKEKFIIWLSGNKHAIEHLNTGKFRAEGEIHQWMYDRYSLKKLLIDQHFINVKKVDAFSSSIPDWENNQWLDVEDGKVRKPDSLFIEAQK